MDWPLQARPSPAVPRQAGLELSRPSRLPDVRPAAYPHAAHTSPGPLTLPRAGRAAVLAAAVVTGQRRRRRRAVRVRVAAARQPSRSGGRQGKGGSRGSGEVPRGAAGEDPDEEGLDPEEAWAPDIMGRRAGGSDKMDDDDWGELEPMQGTRYEDDDDMEDDGDAEELEPDETWGDFRPEGGFQVLGGPPGEDDEDFDEEQEEWEAQGEWEEEPDEEAGEEWETEWGELGKSAVAGSRPRGALDTEDEDEEEDSWPDEPGDEWEEELDGKAGEEWETEWGELGKSAVAGGRPRGALDTEDKDEEEDLWPDEPGDDDDEWGGMDDMQGLRYQEEDPMGGLPDGPDVRKSDAFEGMDEDPTEALPAEPVTARELSLLYDDFEITKKSQTLVTDADATPRVESMQQPRKEREEMRRKGPDSSLDHLEEREYVVAAEGIAVRTLPDERSPRTGEILRQGEKFMAVESVDGEGNDPRLYLRLPKGRGWVFDDEKIYPGLPSVKLVSIGGAIVKDPTPEPVKRPLVAVIGRPNVGKSTLVNRICDIPDVGGNITFDEPGVTRDRTYKQAQHTDDFGDTYLFEVIDTGGLIFYDDPNASTFAKEIKLQIDVALREAVAAIFVCDATTGLVQEDMVIAKYMKEVYMSRGLQVQLAVAKCDRLETMDIIAADFWEIGLGEPFPVCSIHGRGIWELVDKIIDRGCEGLFPMKIRGEDPPPSPREGAIAIALAGKPNAGKSSLLNALVGEARAIVSDIPGTTTDAIDAYLETDNGKVYRFIDTAGIRRRGRIKPGTEWLAVNRTIKAVKRADVALMLLDAGEIMTGARARGLAYWCPDNQQRYIARQIEDKGVACVIVLTKWDSVPNKDEKTITKFTQAIRANLAGVGQWAHIVPCSAATGQRLKKILDTVDKTLEAHEKRVQTQVLNEVVRDALLWRLPAAKGYGKKQGRIYYASQVSCKPPTIALFCNNPKLFGTNYKLYVENKIRQDLGWFGTPLVLEWRKRGERRARSQAEQWLGPRLQPEEAWR